MVPRGGIEPPTLRFSVTAFGLISVRKRKPHPLEELAFFGVTPQSTVVEIWPGGGYWTEILAPFLHDHGVYYAALEGNGASETARAEAEKDNAAFRAKIGADVATYGKIIPTVLRLRADRHRRPRGSADVVLTFRNLHNWLNRAMRPKFLRPSIAP